MILAICHKAKKGCSFLLFFAGDSFIVVNTGKLPVTSGIDVIFKIRLLCIQIRSNLAACHYSNRAYQEYNLIYYDGGDPMNFKNYLDSIGNLTKGIDDEKY